MSNATPVHSSFVNFHEFLTYIIDFIIITLEFAFCFMILEILLYCRYYVFGKISTVYPFFLTFLKIHNSFFFNWNPPKVIFYFTFPLPFGIR
ncbi:hypothetical protein WN944_019226 [Citrus x changshan-huyou]|uniref:Uncharacterized protein n=1 Tax=Citrus x changshan-huyou TaxID=2935761 RepID=A0AAP0LXR7_9ROSI